MSIASSTDSFTLQQGSETSTMATQQGKSLQKIYKATSIPAVPFLATVRTYTGYSLLVVMGYIRDFLRRYGLDKRTLNEDPELKDFPPFFSGVIEIENFFLRNITKRVTQIYFRPICSVPSGTIDVIDRHVLHSGWVWKYTSNVFKDVVNLGSFDYLGFGENVGLGTETAIEAVNTYGAGACSSLREVGNLDIHEILEKATADFLGVDSCITFGMGFGTNAHNISCLVSRGCLVLSDERNHVSMRIGSKRSGATMRFFKHNDMNDLENLLSEAIVSGQPRTHRPWRKILIIAEGIYSMEGTILNLPAVLALKKKYKAYLYVDEAHSIGTIGDRGRGVTDYFGIDPREIDIFMGTYSKTFGGIGGYIAGSRALVEHVRAHSPAACYAVSMPPSVCQKIVTSLYITASTDDGKRRIKKLTRNARRLREGLKKIGVIIGGNHDSPVTPIVMFDLARMLAFSKEMLKKGFAITSVGWPATPLDESIGRICTSASLTDQQIDRALEAISEVADIMQLRYN